MEVEGGEEEELKEEEIRAPTPTPTPTVTPTEKVENDARAHEKMPGGPLTSLEETAGPVTAGRVMNTTGEDRKEGREFLSASTPADAPSVMHLEAAKPGLVIKRTTSSTAMEEQEQEEHE